MERIRLNGNWTLVKKGTLIPIAGQCIKLDIDEDFYQAEARYMFADICLGGSVDFYRESLRLSRDPNIAGALQMYNDSVKILNLWQFERKTYPGNKCNIVFKGSDNRIDGSYAQLSTDLIGDAEVRYKMVDIGLGAPISFYRADAGNETNKIMFKLIEDGVRVMNQCDYERIRFTDLGMLDVFKGTRRQTTGEEVVLSSDWHFDEAPIRKCMAGLALGEKTREPAIYPATLFESIARKRISEGVKVVNPGWPGEGSGIVLNRDRFYNEGRVRELLLLRSLRDQTDLQEDDPDCREAMKRLRQGVTVSEAWKYQLIDGILFYKGSKHPLNPDEITLSSDRIDSAYLVKELMLGVNLGLIKRSGLAKDSINPLSIKALQKIQAGETIKNRNGFEIKDPDGRGPVIVYKGTEKPIKAHDIFLESDHEWSEGQARYIMADMSLGGPLAFYEECTRKGDAIAVEPFNRWMTGVRVTNAEQFERKFVPRIGWKIVYKGTFSIIDPMEVRLTTDQ
jgi:hypothetical protein